MGNIQSIERAVSVLQLLADDPSPVALGEIAALLGLAKPTAHGILGTLVSLGYVRKVGTTGAYLLDGQARSLAHQEPDRSDVRSRCEPWLDALAAHTRLSARLVTFARPTGGGPPTALVVHHVFRPDSSSQVMEVGDRLPLHATALGKVLLALSPRGHRCAPSLALEPCSFRTITTARQLAQELHLTRSRGYAVEHDEHLVGRAAIAAPVHGPGGVVVAAMGAQGGTDELLRPDGRPRPELVARMRDAAGSASRAVVAQRS
ncbi:IclR family transcriptional regulator [Pedococcus sp. 5OH_020]|uniref:IclR family transcriptional regulator n=1 Tax=Pedococcus sp. 5OH_020 TaxID=2989814 RepID=UPI0022E9DA36|nr:IclR family transcriptional regulator [Pedococcus sp. 5OH_020]